MRRLSEPSAERPLGTTRFRRRQPRRSLDQMAISALSIFRALERLFETISRPASSPLTLMTTRMTGSWHRRAGPRNGAVGLGRSRSAARAHSGRPRRFCPSSRTTRSAWSGQPRRQIGPFRAGVVSSVDGVCLTRCGWFGDGADRASPTTTASAARERGSTVLLGVARKARRVARGAGVRPWQRRPKRGHERRGVVIDGPRAGGRGAENADHQTWTPGFRAALAISTGIATDRFRRASGCGRRCGRIYACRS